jgi:hypothetical protein
VVDRIDAETEERLASILDNEPAPRPNFRDQ